MNIEVPTEQFQKIASFIDDATPRIEKLAQHERDLATFAEKTAKALADSGVIRENDVDSVAKDLVEGGFDKISEAFDYVLRKSQEKQAHSMGSTASEHSDRPETADEVYERALGLR